MKYEIDDSKIISLEDDKLSIKKLEGGLIFDEKIAQLRKSVKDLDFPKDADRWIGVYVKDQDIYLTGKFRKDIASTTEEKYYFDGLHQGALMGLEHIKYWFELP